MIESEQEMTILIYLKSFSIAQHKKQIIYFIVTLFLRSSQVREWPIFKYLFNGLTYPYMLHISTKNTTFHASISHIAMPFWKHCKDIYRIHIIAGTQQADWHINSIQV